MGTGENVEMVVFLVAATHGGTSWVRHFVDLVLHIIHMKWNVVSFFRRFGSEMLGVL